MFNEEIATIPPPHVPRVIKQDGVFFALERAHDAADLLQEKRLGRGWKILRGTQQFDYARAITCHKAQGSQWPNVFLFDESSAFKTDADRWLYTAVTRAADTITLVQSAP